MNKRARIRLIGVTAIVLIGVGAILLGAGSKDGAYYRQVSEIVEDESVQGERVQVGGEVVAGSWDQQSNPMRFEIRKRASRAARRSRSSTPAECLRRSATVSSPSSRAP